MNDSDKKARLQSKVIELGQLFLQRTRQELIPLRAHLAQLESGDTAALQPFKAIVHKIHGTGATFGFKAVSDQARELELLLNAQPLDRPPSPAVLTECAIHLSRLADTLEERDTAHGSP